MPRLPRVHVDNGFYHVLARGNNKEEVFHRSEDYLAYLSILDRYTREVGALLHAYVLMPNHVHLIVQVGSSPLPALMQKVQQTYTQHFNSRYTRVGHVFQGRYKAFLVDEDAYLLALIRYIHLNPVRAGITAAPGEYPWSSHHHYTVGEGPGRVHTAFIREVLASYSIKSIEDCESLSVSPANGQAEEYPEGHPARDPGDKPSAFEVILQSVAAVTGVNRAAITGPGRGRAVSRARWLLVYCSVRLAGLSASSVARLVGRSPATVTLAVNEVSAGLTAGDREWVHALTEVEAVLANRRLANPRRNFSKGF